jgi:hypothetical protein
MSDFSLVLFATDPLLVRRAVDAGVENVIIDWERLGKVTRQAEADTQINSDTLEDLRIVRASTAANVICRINGYGSWTPNEVEEAIHAGADEILLPMVRNSDQVEAVLQLVRNRCHLSILIETVDAVRNAAKLNALPLRRIYVGLNDLSIERRTSNIFSAVTDGTLEEIRSQVTLPFGFGGLTLPELGSPIPCRLLIGEMVRLQCQFSFLRRAFHSAARDHGVEPVIERILEAVRQARRRSAAQVEEDREQLRSVVAEQETSTAKAVQWSS